MIITFIAYQESITRNTIDECIEGLKETYPSMRYWYILHNKDTDNEGKPKKEHYHIVLDIDFKNKSHTIYEKKTIAELFGRNTEAIEKVSNPTGILRYLTHKDNDEKHPYEINEVITNDFDCISGALDLEPKAKRTADDDLEDLFQWIEKQRYVSQRALFKYEREKRLFFKFSAVSKIIQDFVKMHNEELEGYKAIDIDEEELNDYLENGVIK